MSAATSAVAAIVANSPSIAPPSFNGDGQLYALNLFVAAGIMSLGIMRGGRLAVALWTHRRRDRLTHPVTLWRWLMFCVCAAVTLRTGAETMYLFGWSPSDPALTARLLMAKRWIDPVSSIFTIAWMTLHDLAGKTIEDQLRRQPWRVPIWARMSELKRPAALVGLSLVMAISFVWARG